MKKKKLILINAVERSQQNLAHIAGNRYPPLGLGIVASLTPDHWDVEIIDENWDVFNYKHADLIGLTAYTPSVCRAYYIASLYKEQGVHTIIGGIHATILPCEAANFVDTVVTGEAETIWPQVISDFENGNIHRLYKGSYHTLINLPKPNRDLFHKGYWCSSIQTSRGCPMSCDFCSVSKFFGNTYRLRPVEEVLDELETIRQNAVFFVDDNIFGVTEESFERSTELFEGIIRRGIKKEWFSHASVNCVDNDQALKLASKSGCKMLFIGFETEEINALNCSGKHININKAKDKYKSSIRKIHKYGISILGGIIYGFDTDTPGILNKRTKFLSKSGIDSYHLFTLTPPPGTDLFDRLNYEKRMLFNEFPENWKKFTGKEIVFKPNLMDCEEFSLALKKAQKRLYNKLLLIWKYFKTLMATRNKSAARWAYYTNLFIGNTYK